MVFDGTKTIRYAHQDAFQVMAPYTIELDVYLEAGSNKVIATNGESFGGALGEWTIEQEDTSVMFYSSGDNTQYQFSQVLIPNYMTKRWYRIKIRFYQDSGQYRCQGLVNGIKVFDLECDPPYDTSNGLSFGADWAYVNSSSPAGSLARRFVGRLRNISLTAITNEAFNAPTWAMQTGNIGTYIENSTISLPLQVFDSENNVQKYEITSGALPGGLSLNKSTGVISGTISPVTQDTVYTFTVKVTDRTKLTLFGTFTINVVNSSTTVNWYTSNSSDLAMPAPGEPVNIQLDAKSE
jgi:hypothetical protein